MVSRSQLIAVVGVVLAMLVYSSVYTVKQTQRAVLLRFGEVNQADLQPGLHWKLPFAEEVILFDGRTLTLDSPEETFFTLEKKPLLVDAFAKWRIKDVSSYYQASSGDETKAMRLLSERVVTGLRNQISRRDMHEVISGQRDQLMTELTADLNKFSQQELGIEVIDVRVKRIDLPTEVSESVYRRMSSERAIEAQQHRATGRELGLGIRADADKKATVIEAEAYRKAEQIRGEGDAKAAAIYANAYSQDPEFYSFYRSLAAYERTFSSKNDVMLLDPKSEFFKYMKNNAAK